MDSQPPAHVSLSMLSSVPAMNPSPRTPQNSANPSNYGSPMVSAPYHLPVELMMYTHPSTPLVVQNAPAPPCVLSTQVQSLVCQSCMYASPSQPCTLHHAPIAYGQPSSSFVPPTQTPASGQQQVISSQQSSVENAPSASQQTVQNEVPQRDSVEIARQHTSLPPTLPPSMRPMTMRLKRGPPMSRVQSTLETGQRTPKLRRVASDSSREIQAVQSEVVQQDVPPSTSQLVSGPVPSGHQSCSVCGPGQRCPLCSPCMCPLCPFTTSGGPVHTHLASHGQQTAPLLLSQGSTSVPMTPSQQAMSAVGMRYVQDALMTNHMHHAFLQQQQLQQHLQQQQIISRLLPNSGLYVLPRGGPLTLGPSGRLELNMLVNVVPSELLVDRPLLERHHMFAAPASEPQPIGLNSQEIDKYTEKMQFVKDIEVPEDEQERCTVCQCEFENGEEVRNLACTHQFHVGCIDRWLGYNKKCPICRIDIDQQKAVFVE